jgi:hypothetical protein
MSSISEHLTNILNEVIELEQNHMTRPDELTAVEEINLRVALCLETFNRTKDINADDGK